MKIYVDMFDTWASSDASFAFNAEIVLWLALNLSIIQRTEHRASRDCVRAPNDKSILGLLQPSTLIPFHTQLKYIGVRELLSLRCWLIEYHEHNFSPSFQRKPRRETLQEFISTAMNQRFFWKYLALFTHFQAGLKCCPMLMLLTGFIFGRYIRIDFWWRRQMLSRMWCKLKLFRLALGHLWGVVAIWYHLKLHVLNIYRYFMILPTQASVFHLLMFGMIACVGHQSYSPVGKHGGDYHGIQSAN